jgi:hypothetical protein
MKLPNQIEEDGEQLLCEQGRARRLLPGKLMEPRTLERSKSAPIGPRICRRVEEHRSVGAGGMEAYSAAFGKYCKYPPE